MKVQVIGWYGESNLGDEHFRSVFRNALGMPLTFSQTAHRDADFMIFGGGGVVCDQYLNDLSTKRGNKIAVGVDVHTDGLQWKRLCESGFDKIWIRSKKYLTDITNRPAQLGQPKFDYVPDITFFDYHKVCHQPKQNVIGVVITKELGLNLDLLKKLNHTLCSLRAMGYRIQFLSYYRGKDLCDDTAARAVGFYNNFEHSDLKCFHTEDPIEMIEEISKYKLLITMRFHGAIHAAMAHTTFLAIANLGKHSLFCEQEMLYQSHCGLGDDILIQATYLLRNNYETMLEQISLNNSHHVEKVFSEVKQYITQKVLE